ncbi:hypothetical protein [Microvirga guangxiensis]|uniref:Phosphohistidine phosphatase n=1 Tax=Microvirga guangxiensis TaxID=549386 RepID=A0A1G5KM99_9HYPH|nr:hypothetical protein [Microvirga guangxiensis]SCZ01444.1 phosphohistidine phosphatase [Microvirga guangxiensis]
MTRSLHRSRHNKKAPTPAGPDQDRNTPQPAHEPSANKANKTNTKILAPDIPLEPTASRTQETTEKANPTTGETPRTNHTSSQEAHPAPPPTTPQKGQAQPNTARTTGNNPGCEHLASTITSEADTHSRRRLRSNHPTAPLAATDRDSEKRDKENNKAARLQRREKPKTTATNDHE